MPRIKSKLLNKLAGCIDGHWAQADSGETIAVINPATGEHLADVPRMGRQETVRAIQAARSAMKECFSLSQRRNWLNAIADLHLANKGELARILTLEHGKPLKESIAEVEYSAGFYRFCAENIEELKMRTLPGRIRGCQWSIHHRPAGVAGLIAPWNFPLGMIAKKFSAALAAGCASVTKPASLTPLSAIALWTLLERLQLPPGMANLVMGRSGEIGAVLCEHPDVRVISFTGSTEVGKTLIAKTADYVKRLSLELGGNAPFIVFEDADLEDAANSLIANKFRSGGQTCVCANRVYVQKDVAEEFCRLLVEGVTKLKVGNGLLADTDIGPLIDRAAFEKVAEHVKDALSRGAKRIFGDDPPRPENEWACFFPPTVIVGVTDQMLVCKEETFGPLIAISEFDDEDQVIQQSNSTPFGLAAYVFIRSQDRAERVIKKLRFGHVGFNTGTGPIPQAPFGGMKQSGFGREGGIEGMFEFCETQVVTAK